MQGHNPKAGFRRVMGRFPTGVVIVATRDSGGAPVGLTVNSFTSVSLDPPLVLVCIAHTSASHDPLARAKGFSVSILSAGQNGIATRFASEPSEGRFDDVDWTPGPLGSPLIAGAAAWMDCTLEDVLPGGDHSILLGRAEAFDVGEDRPMVFLDGSFALLNS